MGRWHRTFNAETRDSERAQRTAEMANRRSSANSNVYAEFQRHFNREEEARNHAVIEIARRLKLPLLATNGVSYATRGNAKSRMCSLAYAITCGLKLPAVCSRIIPSVIVKSPSDDGNSCSPICLKRSRNTAELSSRLEFTLEDLGYEFPRYPVPTAKR